MYLVVKMVEYLVVHLIGMSAELKVVQKALKMVEYLVGNMVDSLVVKKVGN